MSCCRQQPTRWIWYYQPVSVYQTCLRNQTVDSWHICDTKALWSAETWEICAESWSSVSILYGSIISSWIVAGKTIFTRNTLEWPVIIWVQHFAVSVSNGEAMIKYLFPLSVYISQRKLKWHWETFLRLLMQNYICLAHTCWDVFVYFLHCSEEWGQSSYFLQSPAVVNTVNRVLNRRSHKFCTTWQCTV